MRPAAVRWLRISLRWIVPRCCRRAVISAFTCPPLFARLRGEAAHYGRPGLGAQSPLERLGLGDLVLPDGRRLSDFGRGGDGGAPPIQHEGQFYNLASLIRDLPRAT